MQANQIRILELQLAFKKEENKSKKLDNRARKQELDAANFQRLAAAFDSMMKSHEDSDSDSDDYEDKKPAAK